MIPTTDQLKDLLSEIDSPQWLVSESAEGKLKRMAESLAAEVVKLRARVEWLEDYVEELEDGICENL